MKKEGLTIDKIREAAEYVFSQASPPEDRAEYNRNKLEVFQSEDQMSFKIGRLHTGIYGFINLKNNHRELNEGESMEERFTDIHFNGEKLDEEGIEEFWETTIDDFL